jgi:hypothetical protein
LHVVNGFISVDGLSRCNERVGEATRGKQPDGKEPGIVKWSSISRKGLRNNFWFPFVEGYPFAATLWVGLEGFHMTVNGKQITSFEYREVMLHASIHAINLSALKKLLY